MQRLIEINASKDRDRVSLVMEASHGSISIIMEARAYGRDGNEAAVASRAEFSRTRRAAL